MEVAQGTEVCVQNMHMTPEPCRMWGTLVMEELRQSSILVDMVQGGSKKQKMMTKGFYIPVSGEA